MAWLSAFFSYSIPFALLTVLSYTIVRSDTALAWLRRISTSLIPHSSDVFDNFVTSVIRRGFFTRRSRTGWPAGRLRPGLVSWRQPALGHFWKIQAGHFFVSAQGATGGQALSAPNAFLGLTNRLAADHRETRRLSDKPLAPYFLPEDVGTLFSYGRDLRTLPPD